MSGPTEFTIGSEVCSSDGPCGELARVVIDPVARALTHLVVGPKRGGKRASGTRKPRRPNDRRSRTGMYHR